MDNNVQKKNNKNSKKNKIQINQSSNIKKKVSALTNKVPKNIMIIILFVLVFLFLILMIFFSAPYRTNRTIKTLETYQRYQTIKNFDFVNKGETILGNQQIASSYNSCNVRKPYFAYINCKDILYGILKSGARYIEVKIFNDKFGTKNTNPIINNGFETGEWKLCFNSKTFEEFCKVVKENAFSISKKIGRKNTSGVPNSEDPLFISLDLKTRNNIYTLNNVAKLIMKYFGPKLLEKKYRHYAGNLLNIKMNALKGRVVIFASGGHDGSQLTELINGCWEDGGNITRYYIKDIEIMDAEERETLKGKTKQKLTIVTPDTVLDNVIELNLFKKQNYDTKPLFNLGIHFICVYYQSLDNYIDYYITKFKNYAIITKPRELQMQYDNKSNQVDTKKERYTYSKYKNKLQEVKDYLEKIKE